MKRQLDYFSVKLKNIRSQNFTDKEFDTYTAEMEITFKNKV